MSVSHIVVERCAAVRLTDTVRAVALLVIVILAAIVSTGCESSSASNITAPSSSRRCAVTLNGEPRTVPAPGGSGALMITVNRECAWTVNTDVDWISFPSLKSGQGDASVPYVVGSNAAVSSRRGGIVVSDRRLDIDQGAAPCVFTLDHDADVVEASGGTHSVRVSAQSGCSWTALAPVAWLTVTSGGSANGSGVVTIVAERHDAHEPRSGVLTIAGQTFTITQLAAPQDRQIFRRAPTGRAALRGKSWVATRRAVLGVPPSLAIDIGDRAARVDRSNRPYSPFHHVPLARHICATRSGASLA